jgi:hypothetical protein
MATFGFLWHLRYRAASVSPYKWEFVGGSAWTDQDSTTFGLVIGGYQIPPKPTVTVPLMGEYEFEWVLQTNGTAGAATLAYTGLHVNNVADAAIVVGQAIPAMNFQSSSGMTGARRTLAAGDVIKLGISPTATSAAAGMRTLSVKPVRVG